MKKLIFNFNEFVNEAYIGSEGELGDFEFSDRDKYEIESHEHIASLKKFLESSGAIGVKYTLDEELLHFTFSFEFQKYVIEINLDTDFARFISYGYEEYDENVIFEGNVDELFDLIRDQGLYELLL